MKPRLPISTTFSLLLVLAAFSHAQFRDRDSLRWDSCVPVTGTIFQAPGAATVVTSVELQSLSGAEPARSAPISNSSFMITCVPVGHYRLLVIDYRNKVVHSMDVEVSTRVNTVQVLLPNDQAERPASPWVSVSQLKRKIDGKASREFQRALSAADRGKYDEAIQHSHKALEREPAYPEAVVMLGVAHARLGRYEEAAEQFNKAVELDPGFLLAQSNLAVSMLRLQRFGAAEEAARRSLAIARPLPLMEYVLGLSLAAQNRNLTEAIEHLDRASATYPRAAAAAVRLLIAAGRRDDAATRLEKYLRVSGDVEGHKDLESLLATLK